jgi:hypothetical protein
MSMAVSVSLFVYLCVRGLPANKSDALHKLTLSI